MINTEKYVNNLPATLVKNTIYFVKSGSGFDIYVTNDIGTIIAYPMNPLMSNSYDGGHSDSNYTSTKHIDGGHS